MHRLRLALRITAVAVTFPAILLVMLCASLLHPINPPKRQFRTFLRLWMSVLDWVKGIPIGYSYWVHYEAPVMLDEIEVHHDD